MGVPTKYRPGLRGPCFDDGWGGESVCSVEISAVEHKAIRPILLGKTESDCRDVRVRAKFGSPAHRRHEKAAAVDGSRRVSICLVDSVGIFWIFYTR